MFRDSGPFISAGLWHPSSEPSLTTPCSLGLPADGNPNSWPAQVHPEDVDVVQAFAENMADTLEPCELEFRWISNDDSEFICLKLPLATPS